MCECQTIVSSFPLLLFAIFLHTQVCLHPTDNWVRVQSVPLGRFRKQASLQDAAKARKKAYWVIKGNENIAHCRAAAVVSHHIKFKALVFPWDFRNHCKVHYCYLLGYGFRVSQFWEEREAMVFSPINLLLGAQDDAQLGGMFLERSQEKGGYAFSILPSQKIFIFQFMTFFPSLFAK